MFDHIFKTNLTDLSEESGTLQENYDSPANVRNVVFVLSNGNEVMRNYAYLVGVDLLKDGEKNLLEVGFTSDIILIEGYGLSVLRDLFRQHIPRDIVTHDPRYYLPNQENYFIKCIENKKAIS
jgi:hypothetical protein